LLDIKIYFFEKGVGKSQGIFFDLLGLGSWGRRLRKFLKGKRVRILNLL